MERTGHKSLDGVRAYKRSSVGQQGILSSILNNATPPAKKVKLGQGGSEELKKVVGADQPHPVKDTSTPTAHSTIVDLTKENLPSHSTGKHTVVDLTKEHMGPSLNISGCSNISVNYYYK